MGQYVENSLNRNEKIIKKAELNTLHIVVKWVIGILFCWLFFIPTIEAIIATIKFMNIELAITDKRVVGKIGVFRTKTLDAPLNKVQNASVNQGFWGKILDSASIKITTAAGSFSFDGVKNADAFKGMLMAQIEQYEEDRVRQQAIEMANAMSAALKNNDN